METTDDTDGTDRKGLATDPALTRWVNVFSPIFRTNHLHPWHLCNPWSIPSPVSGLMLWWTMRKLKSNDWAARQEAVLALSKSTDPRTIEAITGELEHDDRNVREAAAEILKKIGDPSAVVAVATAEQNVRARQQEEQEARVEAQNAQIIENQRKKANERIQAVECPRCKRKVSELIMVIGSVGGDRIGRREMCLQCSLGL